ncbi:DUF3048 domain-containing protein [Streptomyces abyssomicinicus]|uniref:DUF3048 domain-containing protein n=1 Tax=Streptomyces abyssomicinicus TaxID=574929 RepID=UPI001FECB45A|nr:DUF3048 domain-containing protein [Streptomyces abyssomicinicus]
MIAALALAVGCTGNPSPDRSGDADQAPSGVLAVKVDNVTPARPQTGLAQADVVYAEQVEAGLSRLMALYATRLPPAVGPVRSARETDLRLLRQFDEPVLAYSGSQSRLRPLIEAAPLRAESPGNRPEAWYRSDDRPAPHNLYLRPGRLVDGPAGREALTAAGFREGPAPSGGEPEPERTVRFPSARFTFTWSAERGGWLLETDGRPTTDGGRQLAPPTVLVQYVTVRESGFEDRGGNRTPFSETVGTGTADLLRDGKVWPVRWQRATAADGTRFTTEGGAPVNLADGQVWVVLAAR